jgi:hypothetical protein
MKMEQMWYFIFRHLSVLQKMNEIRSLIKTRTFILSYVQEINGNLKACILLYKLGGILERL